MNDDFTSNEPLTTAVGKLSASPAGRKDDGQDGGAPPKDRWELLPIVAVRNVVRALTFGAIKYAPLPPDNWKSVKDGAERYYAAAMRHLSDWRTGEKNDPETGIPHLAHAACNLLFVAWFEGAK